LDALLQVIAADGQKPT